MSGTSADAMDAALVEFWWQEGDLRFRLLDFVETPYPDTIRSFLLGLCRKEGSDARQICMGDRLVAELAADCALDLIEASGQKPDLIASHGQTIWHQPDPVEAAGRTLTGTLQIGGLSYLAQRTGVTTVGNFRTRDIALGGQGAPLVPLVDWYLFRSRNEDRILLNIGGIANSTLLVAGDGQEETLAFDSGPGNALIDMAAADITDGAHRMDVDGGLAAGGEVNEVMLQVLMEQEYLLRPPPKSTGREWLSRAFYDSIRSRFRNVGDRDFIATLTAFTAESIADSWRRWLLPKAANPAAYVGGGGAKNPVLMHMLAQRAAEVRLEPMESLGVTAEAKEAVAFALLGFLLLEGRPGNLPSVTGASMPALLGEIAPGANFDGFTLRKDGEVPEIL